MASRKYPSSSGSSSRSNSTEAKKILEKPKLNLNKVVNAEEEEEKVKNLLRDDFPDDDADADDIDFITLPMVKEGNFVMFLLIHDLFCACINLTIFTEKLFKKETKLETSDAQYDKKDMDKKPFISETGEGRYIYLL